MTYLEFAGCSLIGLGPPVIIFVSKVARDPLFIILFIISSFFWIASLLCSATWWMIVFPLKEVPAFGLVFSVIFQELFRFLFYFFMRRAESGLKKVWSFDGSSEEKQMMNIKQISLVAGLGFGTVSCLFSLINQLVVLYGPGAVGLTGKPPDYFILSAFMSLAFFLLHTSWNVIFFHGFQHRLYHLPAIVIILHLFVSCMSLLNRSIDMTISVGYSLGLALLCMVWACSFLNGGILKCFAVPQRC